MSSTAVKLYDSKQILVFRFHKEPEIVREKLQILRYFNPRLPIYALFGGEPNDFKAAKAVIGDLVEHVWCFPEQKPAKWKWLHTDIMFKQWFRDYGHTLCFDYVYSYEYDLLTAAPLLEIYPNISDDNVVVAAPTLLNTVEWEWSWTSSDQQRPNFLKFLTYMRRTYGLERQKQVCLGPGPLFPRRFVEMWADAPDSDLVHEEIAIPAYAEVFGFKLIDHGLHPGFNKPWANLYFNCEGREIPRQSMQQELRKPAGRRAFHPVKTNVSLDELEQMLGDFSNRPVNA